MNGDQALSFTSVVSFTLEMQSNMVCSQAVQEAKLEMNERILVMAGMERKAIFCSPSKCVS